MKKKLFTLFFILLISCTAALCARDGSRTDGSVKLVSYMVVKGDKLKNVAARFHVSLRDIQRPNKIISKDYLAYPGRILLIPVHVIPKIWDPSKEADDQHPVEDRGRSEDYEALIDTSASLREDFINLAAARADSMEFSRIDNHMHTIDKRISYLNAKLDSFKRVDFATSYDDKNKTSVLNKMKIARDRYYLEGPIGRQIDSLRSLKTKLGQRRVSLRGVMTEFEYLVDNAAYFQRNYRYNETAKEANWGEGFDNANIPDNVSTQVAKEADTQVAIASQAHNNTESLTEAKPEAAVAAMVADVGESDTSSSLQIVSTHPIFDFAALEKQETTQEMGAMLILPREADLRLPSDRYVLPEITNPVTTSTPSDSTMSIIKTGEAPSKDSAKNWAGNQSAYASASGGMESLGITNNPPSFAMNNSVSQMNGLPDNKRKAASADSSRAMKTVQFKDIPVVEYKNKPKYLIPVDSVTRIKGEFYLLRSRQSMEKGDYKHGEKYLRKSLSLNPNDAPGWMLHADLFVSMGLTDQALKEYLISSEIDSSSPKIYYNIALLYERQNNVKKAYSNFSKAIDIDGRYIMAYIGRASLLIDSHDNDGAIDDYDKVLDIDKYNIEALKGRGIAQMQAKRYPAAIQNFDQYLTLKEKDGFVLYERGLSKIFANNLLQGCLDLSAAKDAGFKEADKAIKKFCQ